MEILQLVDQLEQVLNRGYRLPLSASLVVSEEECLRLIDQMRISVPSAIKESERMVAERDRILQEAHSQAESIIEQARQHALEMIRQDAVTEQARGEAERILARSQEQAQQVVVRSQDEASALIIDAEEYTLDVLQQLIGHLSGALQQVRNGVQTLEESRREMPPSDPK
ncbi:MAG: ATP synthase F0 subunit B [Caldilineaceae bacterium]|nr:ATP synthase F0 subunit B [Caldilineaceae bacterium]HRJ41506.1 ATP synthase F0 subunit B [Caldilineaceae bacterium]